MVTDEMVREAAKAICRELFGDTEAWPRWKYAARAALEAAERAAWRPIETVPKDDELFIAQTELANEAAR